PISCASPLFVDSVLASRSSTLLSISTAHHARLQFPPAWDLRRAPSRSANFGFPQIDWPAQQLRPLPDPELCRHLFSFSLDGCFHHAPLLVNRLSDGLLHFTEGSPESEKHDAYAGCHSILDILPDSHICMDHHFENGRNHQSWFDLARRD